MHEFVAVWWSLLVVGIVAFAGATAVRRAGNDGVGSFAFRVQIAAVVVALAAVILVVISYS